MTAGLLVEGLTVDYGDVLALDHTSFEAGNGATALLGPNGAGKSTLVRCLATVQIPDAGKILFDGLAADTPQEQRSYRRRLGYMPQDPGAYPSWMVRDFVSYIAALKETPAGAVATEVQRVLELVDLTEKQGARVRSLSGGMQQRLALACALLGSPDLLILDEPTAGLDPEQRMRFRQVLSRVAQEACVIISTHLTDEASALCGRVVVLDRGKIRFDGTPTDLADRARDHVWIVPVAHADAWSTWDVADGIREVGPHRPADAAPVAPTLEDGYVVVLREGRR